MSLPNWVDSAPRVVVAGAKPGVRLPLLERPVLLTANGAALLGPPYRARCGAWVISVVDSGVLAKDTAVQQAIRTAQPDELLIVGEVIAEREAFMRETLGLERTVLRTLAYRERFEFLREAAGRRAWLIAAHDLKSPKRLLESLRLIATPERMAFVTASTGMNAVFYARRRFAAAQEIITAGIGLQPGGHFYGVGRMSSSRARADRLLMQAWPPEQRPWLKTTDPVMQSLGRVPAWTGECFTPAPPA
ncbi:MAG: hypothetical protein JJT93_03100 [Gammaproteobacteria bacterium]|nr:hypothetical protein [Gammaproteobacteria bacterium]